MAIDAGSPRAPLGRPRSPEADEAIASAALAVLAESGFEGVTVEAVAHRAGVAKSTVYRRYPGKPELLVTVLQHACCVGVPETDTGTVVGDLVAVAEGLRRSLTTTELGRAMPAVISAASRHDEVGEALRSYIATRRTVALAAVQRGVDRGELDAGLDPELLVDMVVAPLFHRLFVSRRPVTERWIRQLVERAVDGCAPRGAASRPRPGGE